MSYCNYFFLGIILISFITVLCRSIVFLSWITTVHGSENFMKFMEKEVGLFTNACMHNYLCLLQFHERGGCPADWVCIVLQLSGCTGYTSLPPGMHLVRGSVSYYALCSIIQDNCNVPTYTFLCRNALACVGFTRGNDAYDYQLTPFARMSAHCKWLLKGWNLIKGHAL